MADISFDNKLSAALTHSEKTLRSLKATLGATDAEHMFKQDMEQLDEHLTELISQLEQQNVTD
jgi:hypothetical protein